MRRVMLLVAAVLVSVTAPACMRAEAALPSGISHAGTSSGPALPVMLESAATRCSGVAIAGTRLVATAGHCVAKGPIHTVTVDGRRLGVIGEMLHPGYTNDSWNYLYDVALVEVTETFEPGLYAASLAKMPMSGDVRVGGWQWTGASHSEPVLETCERTRAQVEHHPRYISVVCDLPHGASGAGLVATADDGSVVVEGILSTANSVSGENRFAPVSSLIELVSLWTRA